ncbi:ABC transporter ATP-binding protein [Halocatena halophila]|uniref:ABC transporter ATP-binding protein n=1 Tax=Halocatena halophila TaxID=2814576 RepID=UPI002ED4D39C
MNTQNDASISVDNLSVRYPGSDEYVLDGATVEIDAGEFVAVIGKNGSGKTTLCKSFNGLIPHFYDGSFDGRVTVGGIDTADATVSQLSEHVGYVFQEFDNQLVSPTVSDEVAFGPINHGLEDYRERVARALSLLNLDGIEDRFLWELSGGQKHLVALAAVLSLDPSILVVDEPAAQLDPVHAGETYDHLAALNHEQGMTIVAIEHQTEFIAEYCDSVVLVEDGRVAWKAPVERALNRLEDLRRNDIQPPQITRTAAKISDTNERLPIGFDEGCRWFRNVLDSTTMHSPSVTVADAGENLPVRDNKRTPLIRLSSVSHTYPTLRGEDKQVLDALDLAVYSGDRVALVGSNGAGKSTILELLTGLKTPTEGTVSITDTDTATTLPERIADDVVYVPQNPESMFVKDSIRADIAHYLQSRDLEDVAARTDDVVSFLDLEALEDRDGRLLSVGQQRRASLAIGVATAPSIILLDEPTGSLDLASRMEIGRTISRAGERVETVIMATHDLELAAEWANRILVLDNGEILMDGPPKTVFAATDVLAEANLEPPQVVRLSEELGCTSVALSTDELVSHLTSERPTASTGASHQ